jgi:hypothetical protein
LTGASGEQKGRRIRIMRGSETTAVARGYVVK